MYRHTVPVSLEAFSHQIRAAASFRITSTFSCPFASSSQCVPASSRATKSGKYDFRFIAASVYSMEKPNICGSFAKARTSEQPSKNLANSRSKSLSQGTRLKTVLTPSHTGRDQGKGWQVESTRDRKRVV